MGGKSVLNLHLITSVYFVVSTASYFSFQRTVFVGSLASLKTEILRTFWVPYISVELLVNYSISVAGWVLQRIHTWKFPQFCLLSALWFPPLLLFRIAVIGDTWFQTVCVLGAFVLAALWFSEESRLVLFFEVVLKACGGQC